MSDHGHNHRSALVESRLRHLVLKLEFVENLTLAHPFMKGFDRTATCHNEQEAIEAGRGIFVSSPPCTLPSDTGDANAMDTLQTELPQPAQLSASESATTLDKTPFAATTEATDTPSIATESSAAEITAVATTAEAPRTVYTTTFYIGLATEPKAPGDATRRKVVSHRRDGGATMAHLLFHWLPYGRDHSFTCPHIASLDLSFAVSDLRRTSPGPRKSLRK